MKKFIYNPWTISIGTVLLTPLLTLLADWIRGIAALSTLKWIASKVWSGITGFLNYELKVWWLLVGIAIIALAFILFLLLYSNSLSKKEHEQSFLAYKSDSILGLEWEWEWERGYSGKYEIANLMPVCSYCHTPLTHDGSLSQHLICIRCGRRSSSEMPRLENVKIIIIDNVRKNRYPKQKSTAS